MIERKKRQMIYGKQNEKAQRRERKKKHDKSFSSLPSYDLCLRCGLPFCTLLFPFLFPFLLPRSIGFVNVTSQYVLLLSVVLPCSKSVNIRYSTDKDPMTVAAEDEWKVAFGCSDKR